MHTQSDRPAGFANVLVAYDAVNRRVAAREYISINGDTSMVVDMYNDHAAGIKYTVESTSGKPTRCYKQALGPFVEGCVPDNATKSAGNYVRGLGSNSLAASAFQLICEPYALYLEVTDKGCIPVEELAIGSLHGCKHLQNE
ncbi:hypothetical protein CHS0354_032089 [Potamilus streckersoni]|uniref:Uncharacterized protein n=1 Tax=Potamilus streckersoni TaxID=2493646 RepID=A0AAE0TPN3_9BIVA|nr:hypothetical protein CHS0354_032089 [Potamilus streckersoni]